MEKVLKNIVCFLDILKTSSTEQVTLWNEDSIRNAYKWASYCEEIYKQAEGKPYYSNLCTEIRNLSRSLLDTNVDTAFLKHSSKCLTKTLLLNTACSASLSLLILSQNGIRLETVFPEKSEMFLDIHGIERMSSFLKSVMTPRGSSDDSSLPAEVNDLIKPEASERFIGCLTELLLQRLRQLSRVSDGRLVQQRMCLEDNLRLLCDSVQQAEEVIAMVVIRDKSSEKPLLSDDIQSSLFNFLLSVADKNSRSLWNLDLNILCRLCMDNSLLLSVYLQYLIKCCSKLVLVYNEAPICDPNEMISWRCTDTTVNSLKYEELLFRLKHLTDHGTLGVTTKVTDTLQRLGDRDGEISIWANLLKYLKL